MVAYRFTLFKIVRNRCYSELHERSTNRYAIIRCSYAPSHLLSAVHWVPIRSISAGVRSKTTLDETTDLLNLRPHSIEIFKNTAATSFDERNLHDHDFWCLALSLYTEDYAASWRFLSSKLGKHSCENKVKFWSASSFLFILSASFMFDFPLQVEIRFKSRWFDLFSFTKTNNLQYCWI